MNEPHLDQSKLALVGIAPNEIVGDLWRQVLLEEGIVALVKPVGLGHAYISNSLNPHHVFTRVDQADLARDVIASLSDETDTADDSSAS